MRLAPLALAAGLFATTALAGGLGEMTEDERAVFRDEVRAFLIDNPEVITEAMDVLQARQDRAAAERDLQLLADNRDAIMNDPASWAGGNLDGDITVVEFMDYRCGYCKQAFADVDELVKSDGKIRFVVKEFPILGEQSLLASKFAVAVLQLHGDEAYDKTHRALMAFRGEISADTLGRLAADLGHDPAALLAKMETPEVLDVLKANHALADKLEITGTPMFVIDKTMVRGAVPLEGLRQIVAGQREG